MWVFSPLLQSPDLDVAEYAMLYFISVKPSREFKSLEIALLDIYLAISSQE